MMNESQSSLDIAALSEDDNALVAKQMDSIRMSVRKGGLALTDQIIISGFSDLNIKPEVEREEKHEESNKWEEPHWTPTDHKIFHIIGFGILGLLSYIAILFLFGLDMTLPDGPIWSCFFLWVMSFGVGQMCDSVGVPSLLGQLLTGLILRNLPGDEVFLNIPTSWGNQIKSFGLCTIFLRSGLELDIPAIIKQGFVAMRLTACPGLVEALVVGGIGHRVFDMPFALAVSLGFILAAVSPAVVVTGMFDLQHRGYGVKKGIPSLVVAAASFDDVVALTGFSVAIGSALPSSDNPILGYLHAPIEVIGAFILGTIGGHICGCTVMWNKPWKRMAIIFACGLAVMYFAVYFHYNSMGALGALVIGLTAARCWGDGRMGSLSLAPNHHFPHEVEHDVARVWRLVAAPLLFAVIGASIDFSEIAGSTIPKAIIVIICGVTLRCITAVVVTWGADLSVKERVFIGLSWIPKATVQAALGSIPLTLIEENMSADDDNYHEYEEWGKAILVTAVFAILITAPIGVICIDYFGPRWLDQEVHLDEDEEQHKKEKLNWAVNEARRRLDIEHMVGLNKQNSLSFFGQLKDEIETIEHLAETVAQRSTTEKDKNDKDVERINVSIKRVTDAVSACEELINAKGADFPVPELFKRTPGFDAHPRAAIDPITGRAFQDSEDTQTIQIPKLMSGLGLMSGMMKTEDGMINIPRKLSGFLPVRRTTDANANVNSPERRGSA